MSVSLFETATCHSSLCPSHDPQKHASHRQCLMRPLWNRRVARISGLYHKNSDAFLKYSCRNRVKSDVIIQCTVTQSTLEAVLHHANTYSIKALAVCTWRLLEVTSRVWVCACKSWEKSWTTGSRQWEVAGSLWVRCIYSYWPAIPSDISVTNVGNNDIFGTLLNLFWFTKENFIYYKLEEPC